MDKSKKLQSILDSEEWQQASKLFQESMDLLKEEQESFWNSLNTDDQLKAFCAVVRRIYKGEVSDRTSYRGVLYDVFGFGHESYAQAQCSGYLDIHNIMYDGIHLNKELKRYIDALNKISTITTNEEILNIIKDVTSK